MGSGALGAPLKFSEGMEKGVLQGQQTSVRGLGAILGSLGQWYVSQAEGIRQALHGPALHFPASQQMVHTS